MAAQQYYCVFIYIHTYFTHVCRHYTFAYVCIDIGIYVCIYSFTLVLKTLKYALDVGIMPCQGEIPWW